MLLIGLWNEWIKHGHQRQQRRQGDDKSLLFRNEGGRERELIKSIESTRDTSHITHFAYSTWCIHCTHLLWQCMSLVFPLCSRRRYNHCYAQLCYRQFIKSNEYSESIMEAKLKQSKAKQTKCNDNRAMTVKRRKVYTHFHFLHQTNGMNVIYRLFCHFEGKKWLA